MQHVIVLPDLTVVVAMGVLDSEGTVIKVLLSPSIGGVAIVHGRKKQQQIRQDISVYLVLTCMMHHEIMKASNTLQLVWTLKLLQLLVLQWENGTFATIRAASLEKDFSSFQKLFKNIEQKNIFFPF